MNTYKVLVHPVRSRIVGSLSGRRLTRQQLERLMPEVPPPTLYRNLRVLLDAGMVETVERLPRRGVEEHVYAMREGGAWLDHKEMEAEGPQAWLKGLETFLTGISTSYRAYLAAGGNKPCPAAGRIVHLTPEELGDLHYSLAETFARFTDLPPDGRERFVISVVTQPDQWPEG